MAEIQDLKPQVVALERSAAEAQRLHCELTVEATYHADRIEGNPLTDLDLVCHMNRRGLL